MSADKRDEIIRNIAITFLESAQDKIQELVGGEDDDEQLNLAINGIVYASVMMARHHGVNMTQFCKLVRQEYKGLQEYENAERRKIAN